MSDDNPDIPQPEWLPTPEMLAQFEENETSAELIRLSMSEFKRSIELEREELAMRARDMEADRLEKKRGQQFGLCIGIVAIVVGGMTAILTSIYGEGVAGQVAGSIIGGGGVVGLVAVFVLGRRPNSIVTDQQSILDRLDALEMQAKHIKP